jgi:hypothetical protein
VNSQKSIAKVHYLDILKRKANLEGRREKERKVGKKDGLTKYERFRWVIQLYILAFHEAIALTARCAL